jgi:hypothetical protein
MLLSGKKLDVGGNTGKGYFYLFRNVQTSPGAHSVHQSEGTRFISGVKSPESKVFHCSPFCVEVKNEWSYTSTPTYDFMACTGTTLLLPVSYKY